MSAALKQQLPWIKRTVMAALGIAPPADPNVVETQADSQFSAFEETQADAVTAHDVLGLAGQVIQLISVDCTGDCHRVVLSDRQHTIVAYVSDAGDAIALGQSRSDEVPDTRAALVKRKGGLFVLDAFYVATERIALPGFQHVGAPRFCLVIDRMRYWGSAGAVGTPRDLRSDDAVARILANTPVKRLHEVLAHVQRPPRASAFSRSFSEFLPWAARPERKKGLARRPRGSAAPGAMVVLDAEAHRVPFNQHALLPELVDGLVAGVPPTASASSSSSVTGAPAAVLVSETRAARAAAPEHDVQTQGLTIANHLAKFKTSMSVPGRGLVRIPVGAGFAKPVAELYATDPTFCAEYAAAIATPMDIGTIQKRLRAGARFYGDDVEKLYRDFELIVSNCRTFNVGASGLESRLLASALDAECKRLFALRFPLFAAPPPLPLAQRAPLALEACGARAEAALTAAAREGTAAAAAATARVIEELDADESDDAWTIEASGGGRAGNDEEESRGRSIASAVDCQFCCHPFRVLVAGAQCCTHLRGYPFRIVSAKRARTGDDEREGKYSKRARKGGSTKKRRSGGADSR